MKAVRSVLEFLSSGGVEYIFGIPAGSVNAFFDELYTMPHMTPVVAKHEGAAAYMAAGYAKYSGKVAVCIGCSGPGSTNLLTGAVNAMREQLPVLFLTGAVPTATMGLNASQELDAAPIFKPVTKYSVTVRRAEDLLTEVAKALEIALEGVSGPVHVAMPIDLQLQTIDTVEYPPFPSRKKGSLDSAAAREAAAALIKKETGYIFVGQGAVNGMGELLEIAEILNWPLVTTPQAKGLVLENYPLYKGIFGFAGHEEASKLVNEGNVETVLIVGSSLGETATNNYNKNLTENRFVIQIDHDPTVFNRKYKVDIPVLGDTQEALGLILDVLKQEKREGAGLPITESIQSPAEVAAASEIPAAAPETAGREVSEVAYNTQSVLGALQKLLPSSTRYNIDIGEFMSYVIHYMKVTEPRQFNVNVHFGAMGTAIGSALGMAVADASKPVACITGDGCFFMHGMEVLTAREYNLPILFIVMNNARLGMVYHGHALQYKRAHACFEQQPTNIARIGQAMGIPSLRIEKMEDLDPGNIQDLLRQDGPAILEIALVDNNVPPMGDRVKFLSSFGK